MNSRQQQQKTISLRKPKIRSYSIDVLKFMGEARRWSVEAKEFELLVKGGLSGVRLVEKRNNRMRSICVQRDEILWLLGAVEKAANVDTSEVFWDQSRAGYIRLTTQRRANRHGRFLTIEEYDGRRRSGSVLIPEGWSGQGWHRLISELRLACSSLKVGRGIRMDKPEMVTGVKRSFAEVVGATKRTENYGSQLPEPISGMGLRAGDTSASVDDSREKATSSTQFVPEPQYVPSATGGLLQQPQNSSGMNQGLGGAGVLRRSAEMLPGMSRGEKEKPRGRSQGVTCQGAKSNVKGRMEASFNAKQELGGLREWLRQLRSEVDAGLVRVDVVLKKLENIGPGQVQKKAVWISKTKPKKKLNFKEKRPNSNGTGVGLDPGPAVMLTKAQTDGTGPSAGPSVVNLKSMVRSEGAGTSVGLGLSEGPVQKPKLNIQVGSEKPAGLGRSEGWDRTLGGLGSLEGPDLSGGGGDLSFGSVGLDSIVPESIPAEATSVEGIRREGGCIQLPPTGYVVSSEPQGKLRTAPVSGSGNNRGNRSLVSRPEGSWVAGRTGFGPVHTGEVVGSTDMVGFSVTEAVPSALMVSVQNDTNQITDRADKVVPAGEDKVDQACYVENTVVLEVYRRRDVLSQGNLKMLQSENGNLEDGDKVETSLQGGDHGQGVGQSNDENSLVENTLKMSMEVSNVAGLSCDGQEGRKEECLRRIVVEKVKTGCGEDTVNSDFQQAANIMGRFWGNDSDDEA
jgi:hypothetical protein